MKKLILLLLICITMQAKNLTFAVINLPPYVYFKDNKAQGFNVEILNAIFKRMDIEIRYEKIPWARAILMLKNGQIDALFPLLKTANREIFVDYSNSFTSEPIALFVQAKSMITYNGSLDDLKAYDFGRVRGYSSGKVFDQAVEDKRVSIEESTTSEQNILKFLKGRFDVLVDNQYYIKYYFKKHHQSHKIKMLTPLLSNSPAYLGFSKQKNHKALIQQFNQVLEEIKNDGTYDAIVNQYFGEY